MAFSLDAGDENCWDLPPSPPEAQALWEGDWRAPFASAACETKSAGDCSQRAQAGGRPSEGAGEREFVISDASIRGLLWQLCVPAGAGQQPLFRDTLLPYGCALAAQSVVAERRWLSLRKIHRRGHPVPIAEVSLSAFVEAVAALDQTEDAAAVRAALLRLDGALIVGLVRFTVALCRASDAMLAVWQREQPHRNRDLSEDLHTMEQAIFDAAQQVECSLMVDAGGALRRDSIDAVAAAHELLECGSQQLACASACIAAVVVEPHSCHQAPAAALPLSSRFALVPVAVAWRCRRCARHIGATRLDKAALVTPVGAAGQRSPLPPPPAACPHCGVRVADASALEIRRLCATLAIVVLQSHELVGSSRGVLMEDTFRFPLGGAPPPPPSPAFAHSSAAAAGEEFRAAEQAAGWRPPQHWAVIAGGTAQLLQALCVDGALEGGFEGVCATFTGWAVSARGASSSSTLPPHIFVVEGLRDYGPVVPAGPASTDRVFRHLNGACQGAAKKDAAQLLSAGLALAHSIAPELLGVESQKLLLLLACVANLKQETFVAAPPPGDGDGDGDDTGGGPHVLRLPVVNVLLVGQHGCGKSTLLSHLEMVVPGTSRVDRTAPASAAVVCKGTRTSAVGSIASSPLLCSAAKRIVPSTFAPRGGSLLLVDGADTLPPAHQRVVARAITPQQAICWSLFRPAGGAHTAGLGGRVAVIAATSSRQLSLACAGSVEERGGGGFYANDNGVQSSSTGRGLTSAVKLPGGTLACAGTSTVASQLAAFDIVVLLDSGDLTLEHHLQLSGESLSRIASVSTRRGHAGFSEGFETQRCGSLGGVCAPFSSAPRRAASSVSSLFTTVDTPAAAPLPESFVRELIAAVITAPSEASIPDDAARLIDDFSRELAGSVAAAAGAALVAVDRRLLSKLSSKLHHLNLVTALSLALARLVPDAPLPRDGGAAAATVTASHVAAVMNLYLWHTERTLAFARLAALGTAPTAAAANPQLGCHGAAAASAAPPPLGRTIVSIADGPRGGAATSGKRARGAACGPKMTQKELLIAFARRVHAASASIGGSRGAMSMATARALYGSLLAELARSGAVLHGGKPIEHGAPRFDDAVAHLSNGGLVLLQHGGVVAVSSALG